MKSSAEIVGDYRYVLFRRWGETGQVLFIGLNPSTADATQNDQTIRRMMRFAKDWGYGGITVANLFAYRATDFKELKKVEDPIGLLNDKWLQRLIGNFSEIVICWGNGGSFKNRSTEVLKMILEAKCFGVNKSGEPKHLLYLSKYTKLVDY